MADAQGSQTNFYVEPQAAAHTFDASSEIYELLSESVQATKTIVDSDGIRGTRSHASERTRAGTYTVGGSFTFNPSPADLLLWLPRILGAAGTGGPPATNFTLSETLPTFGLLFDRDTNTFEYTDCFVSRAIFRGSGNELISLEIEIMGTTEVVGSSISSPPSLGTADNDAPYHFIDSDNAGTSRLILIGSPRRMLSFEIEINNFLEARVGNSQTATSITPQDRLVRMAVELPYDSDNSNLYAGTDATGSLVLTNGGMSTTFTFGILQTADISPTIPGKTAINMNLEMIARKLGSTDELAITHDSVA